MLLAGLVQGAALAAAYRPSLVIVISVDQMREEYLERFRPWFGRDGFNRFLRNGAEFTEANHRHANTFTGPGHASIGTGLDPRDHGIVQNCWYDREKRRRVYCVEDLTESVIGAPDGVKVVKTVPASPRLLRTTSARDRSTRTSGHFALGDRLKQAFPGARVVGLGLKDRSAVLMAGKDADAVYWFSDELGRFVTSSYYPKESFPAMLAFDETLPASLAKRECSVWEPLTRKNGSPWIPGDLISKVLFDPPELSGFKEPGTQMEPAFPHPLNTPHAKVSSPCGDLMVLDFSRVLIEKMALGGRDRNGPDLLFIAMCSMDYYGHMFGPDSREIADGMVRLDAALEAFFGWLDLTVGRRRVLIWLTADHGVAAIPEFEAARPRSAAASAQRAGVGRIDLDFRKEEIRPVRDGSPARLAIERALATRHGYDLHEDEPNRSEGVVAAFDEPCLTLNPEVVARRAATPNLKAPVSGPALRSEIGDLVRAMPGVLKAYTHEEMASGLPADDPFRETITRSFDEERTGDICAVLEPGWIWSNVPKGTTHGQPHRYDTHVPLLVWGVGVRPGSYSAPVSPLAIARTTAALFGLDGVGEPDVLPLGSILAGYKPVRRKAAAR